MQSYIGAKIIKAIPMTDVEFEEERSHFNGAKHTVRMYNEGHCLLRDGQGCRPSAQREPKDGYKVMYPGEYFSWSPKYVFEEAYRLISSDEKKLI